MTCCKNNVASKVLNADVNKCCENHNLLLQKCVNMEGTGNIVTGSTYS